MSAILIIEDDKSARRSLELHLQREGHRVESASDGRTGADMALDAPFDLVLLDLKLPEMDGFDVLRKIRERKPSLPVIVITAFDEMQTAIEAIKLGAADQLGKPLDLDRLDQAMSRALDLRRIPCQEGFATEIDAPRTPHLIVGKSQTMKEVFKAIGLVADSSATVLLRGESGTGKELAARAIHRNSPRAERPFVPVTCSILAPNLVESELFGHEKGAFTGAEARKIGKFERASGGTLFLDEISEIPLATQVKLLRFLQEREFERVGGNEPLRADVRVIAATHRDLERMVAEGSFRHDLYYRLNVFAIRLPPLRGRMDDLPLLVRHFLQTIGRELGKRVEVVPDESMALLRAHPWPGNVRELENTIRRAILLSTGPVLLPEALRLEEPLAEGAASPAENRSLDEVEKEHIERVLRFTGFEKRRASEILKISRPTLDRKIREYGILLP